VGGWVTGSESSTRNIFSGMRVKTVNLSLRNTGARKEKCNSEEFEHERWKE
jgi:hypothetical protein